MRCFAQTGSHMLDERIDFMVTLVIVKIIITIVAIITVIIMMIDNFAFQRIMS